MSILHDADQELNQAHYFYRFRCRPLSPEAIKKYIDRNDDVQRLRRTPLRFSLVEYKMVENPIRRERFEVASGSLVFRRTNLGIFTYRVCGETYKSVIRFDSNAS